jgi:hypothetical protein
LTDDLTFIVRTSVRIEGLPACCHVAKVGCCCLVNCWNAVRVNCDKNDMMQWINCKEISSAPLV